MTCNSCKYWDRDVNAYPCNGCIHAALDRFEHITNFDKIKKMSVEDLANFICDIYASNEHHEIRVDGKWMLPEDVEEWLGREVDE